MKSKLLPLQIFSIILSVVLVIACKKSEVEPIKATNDINSLIRSIPELSPLPSNGTTTQATNKQTYTLSNAELSCDETKYLINKTTEEFMNVNFDGDATSSELYPGSIVKLKELRNKGALNSIGNIAREDLTLSTTLSNAPSQKVTTPTASSIKDAIIGMVGKYKNNVKAQYTYTATEAHNTEQGLLELGLNVGYGLLSTNSKFKVSEK